MSDTASGTAAPDTTVTDSQRKREREAVEAAYAAEVGRLFGVLCYALAGGDDPKFDVALTNVRRARVIALAAIEL